MVAAVACLYGHDPKDDAVCTAAYLSLIGGGAIASANKAGASIGTKSAMAALKKLPGRVLTRINRYIGYRLLTKFGEKGVINLVKHVPVAGGIAGGMINALGTRATGAMARRMLQPA
jgi:hypothetical protein